MTTPTHHGKRLGLMGGTFNPPHLGHLQAAEEIAETFKLDKIYFIPSAWPPHKSASLLVDYKHRLEMIQLAVSGHPTFRVYDLESTLSAPSYAVNTVKAFQSTTKPEDSTFFLVGLDSFMSLGQWHQFHELVATIPFIVMGRSGIKSTCQEMWEMLRKDLDPKVLWNPQTHIFSAEGIKPIFYQPRSSLDISSTSLRARLEARSSVRYLVPEPVRIYIDQHGLYRPE